MAGLECYVCSNQTGNTEKCLNTIKTCEPFENVCGTEIRWGSQPYFSEGALKQYYVSKRCMTKEQCQSKRKRYMQLYCTHIWYEDWRATSAAREIGATTLSLWVDSTFNWDYQLIGIVTEWRSFKTRLWCLFNPAHRTIRTWILAHSTLLASRAFAIPSTFRFLYYLNEAVHKLSRFHTPFKTTPSKCLDSVGK